MFYTTDPQDRAEFITALRSLADFLAGNSAAPVPLYGDEITLHADSYEDGGKAQVDFLARVLGAPVTDNRPDGHYAAHRSFGCIDYQAVSIPQTWTAMRDAQQSYETSIILDAVMDSE